MSLDISASLDIKRPKRRSSSKSPRNKHKIQKAIAKTSFKDGGKDCLTFEIGDEIIVKSKGIDGWWKGKSGDQIGYFPESYVDLVKRGDSPYYLACHRFEKVSENVLGMEFGDMIVKVADIGNGWNYGKNLKSGQVGAYPSDFVTGVGSRDETFHVGFVLAGFEGKDQGELSVPPGERVTLIKVMETGWALCLVGDKIGSIPKSFIYVPKTKQAGIAVVEHRGKSDIELSFPKNSPLVIFELVSKNWYLGATSSRAGFFPHEAVRPADRKREKKKLPTVPSTSSGSSSDAIKKALLMLQNQTKQTIDGMIRRIEHQENEKQKILYILKEVGTVVTTSVAKSSELEKDNKKIQGRLEYIEKNSKLSSRDKPHSELTSELRNLNSTLQSEISHREQLESKVGALRSDMDKIMRHLNI